MGCAQAFKSQTGHSSPFVSWHNILKFNALKEIGGAYNLSLTVGHAYFIMPVKSPFEVPTNENHYSMETLPQGQHSAGSIQSSRRPERRGIQPHRLRSG